MKIGIPKEIYPGERRVASTPEIVKHLVKLGFEVFVESEAGIAANFSDKSFHSKAFTSRRSVFFRFSILVY